MRQLAIIFLMLFSLSAYAQETVNFNSPDSVEVYADLYLVSDTLPFLVLLHQQGSSRGEFRQTASRFNKLGFNCLAVDLRNGGEINYIRNETSAALPRIPASVLHAGAELDIRGAVAYLSENYNTSILLLGSSISATLALKVAATDSLITAAIAFSPGEYFLPGYSLKEDLADFDKPLFVAGARREYDFLTEMISLMPAGETRVFQPENGPGMHGSRSLWPANPNNDEYWLALLLFLRNLRE